MADMVNHRSEGSAQAHAECFSFDPRTGYFEMYATSDYEKGEQVSIFFLDIVSRPNVRSVAPSLSTPACVRILSGH
jgi:hypothetical protein